MFSAELDDRDARRRERRITEARFPRLKRLAEFNLGAVPSINPATLAALETGAWIDASEPVVLLGDSGTGKSHLLIGLEITPSSRADGSAMSRRRGWSTSSPRWPTSEPSRASSCGMAGSTCCCSTSSPTSHLDARGAELLFQVLTEREERASVAVASNAPFSEWGQTFTDPVSRQLSSIA